jgi:hypothetical protein
MAAIAIADTLKGAVASVTVKPLFGLSLASFIVVCSTVVNSVQALTH